MGEKYFYYERTTFRTNGVFMGQVVRKFRLERKMTQRALAKLINTLDQSQISKIERGERLLKEDEIIEFARALRVSINNFYACYRKMKRNTETLNNEK